MQHSELMRLWPTKEYLQQLRHHFIGKRNTVLTLILSFMTTQLADTVDDCPQNVKLLQQFISPQTGMLLEATRTGKKRQWVDGASLSVCLSVVIFFHSFFQTRCLCEAAEEAKWGGGGGTESRYDPQVDLLIRPFDLISFVSFLTEEHCCYVWWCVYEITC